MNEQPDERRKGRMNGQTDERRKGQMNEQPDERRKGGMNRQTSDRVNEGHPYSYIAPVHTLPWVKAGDAKAMVAVTQNCLAASK